MRVDMRREGMMEVDVDRERREGDCTLYALWESFRCRN